jgi:hypothetical protein
MKTRVMQNGLRMFAALLLALLAAAGAARADSWMPPRPETYVSADGATRLKVVPRSLASSLRYFEDLTAGRRPAGQPPGSDRQSAQGQLERREPGGRWRVQWRGPLVNDVAPVSALVANDGRFAVTFDNWHFMGHGDDAVVIYDGTGQVVRAMALTDFLPADYVAALPRSVSSLHWGCDHRLAADGATLILSIRVPSEDGLGTSDGAYVELALDLASGRPAALAGPAWERALAEARRVRASQVAAEAENDASFANPLLPPSSQEELGWYRYLNEAFFRLDPAWRQGYPATSVLRLPDAADYRASRDDLRATLGEEPYEGQVMMFASPASDNLADVLAAEVGRLRSGALRQARIYIVAADPLWPRMAGIFARSGATLVQIDPAQPIPQRPERLRERAASP